MKLLTVIIERNEDAFYAFVKEIDGCVAGGKDFQEIKTNIVEMINIAKDEDCELRKMLDKGYKIKYEVDLVTIFDLMPEVNISQLAKTGKINPGLLRQYVSGTKKASEAQALKIMRAIQQVSEKLSALSLGVSSQGNAC
jgi:predicted RNase H-like HicB family nuclease